MGRKGGFIKGASASAPAAQPTDAQIRALGYRKADEVEVEKEEINKQLMSTRADLESRLAAAEKINAERERALKDIDQQRQQFQLTEGALKQL